MRIRGYQCNFTAVEFFAAVHFFFRSLKHPDYESLATFVVPDISLYKADICSFPVRNQQMRFFFSPTILCTKG